MEEEAKRGGKVLALPALIRASASMAVAQASMPFSAGQLALSIAQKTALSIAPKPIPAHQIAAVRKLGHLDAVAALERLNVCVTPVRVRVIKQCAFKPQPRTLCALRVCTIHPLIA